MVLSVDRILLDGSSIKQKVSLFTRGIEELKNHQIWWTALLPASHFPGVEGRWTEDKGRGKTVGDKIKKATFWKRSWEGETVVGEGEGLMQVKEIDGEDNLEGEKQKASREIFDF